MNIKIIEDINPWVTGAQFASALAIIIAAYIAGSHQKRNRDSIRKVQQTYYLGIFTLFIENIDMYFSEAFNGPILPPVMSPEGLWAQIEKDFNSIKSDKLEIVQVLPLKSIKSFQFFLDSFEPLLHSPGESDEIIAEFWKFPRKKLYEVLYSLKLETKPKILQILLSLNPKKKKISPNG